MQIRPCRPDDADALAQIYFDAVHIGAAPKYTAIERAAWAPTRPDATLWANRLASLITVVACDPAPEGFMSLRRDGLLDLAFVSPDRRGKGLADALHGAILDQARTLNLQGLTTDASLMARPFFLRMGWQTDAACTVQRHGVALANFRMSRALCD